MGHKRNRIVIEVIPKCRMRYDTCGDWYIEDGALHIDVVDQGSDDEQFLIALHELIEWKLCASQGISQNVVDAFDLTYEGEGEPGDDPAAPYRKAHRFAMLLEHMMAHELGLNGYGTVV